MDSLPQNKVNFFNPRSIREWLGRFSSVKQFMILLAGFVILICIQFVLGFSLLLLMSYRVESGSLHFQRDLKSISRFQGELAELKLLYHEKYLNLSQRSPAGQLAALQQQLPQFKLLRKDQPTAVGLSLKKLAQLSDRPFDYQTYRSARQEVQKLQALFRQAEKNLPGRSNVFGTILTGLVLFLFLLLTTGSFIIWAWAAIQVVNEHQQALDYYQTISKKFKDNQIERNLKEFRSNELKELQAALTKYFENLRTRYLAVHNYINELLDELRVLNEATKQNDSFGLSLQASLQQLIDNTYHKLDSFPDLAVRVKFLNNSLQESGTQAATLQDSLDQAGKIIKSGPENVNQLSLKLDRRANNADAVVADLKELRGALDQIQQAVTVFEGLTEQTSVLSLNAAIEAARAGTAGDGFDIAANKIGELADRIGKIPHELLRQLNKEKKQGEQVLRNYEALLPQHNQVKQYLDGIKGEMKGFWDQFGVMLAQVQEFGALVHQYELRRQSLEELTGFLAEMNRRIPEDYSKVAANLDVVDKRDQVPLPIGELENLILEVNQLLAKMDN